MTRNSPAVLIAAAALLLGAFGSALAQQDTVEPGAAASQRTPVIRASSGSGPAQRYFVWDGEPLVLVGDSLTQAWMETGGDFNADAYLDALASRSINATLLWAYIGSSADRRSSDQRIGYAAPTVWPWCRGADGSFDLACFDTAYFDSLRSFVDKAAARRIAVILTVHDGWPKTRFDEHPFNVANGGPLGDSDDYVVLGRPGESMPAKYDSSWSAAELNQYYQEQFCQRLLSALEGTGNVLFELFNEGDWYAADKRREHEEHFASFFARRTSAPILSNTDHISGDDPRANPSIAALSLHLPKWSEQTTAREVFEWYLPETSERPIRPVLFSETVPEFSGDVAHTDSLMRVMWGALMSGAQVLVQDDVSFRFAADTNMADYAEEGDALLDRIGIAARFFAALPVTRMQADPSLCATGVCLAAPGESYVVYAENTDSLWVRRAVPQPFPVRVRWLDPRSGTVTAAESRNFSERLLLRPPFADSVLRLDALASLPEEQPAERWRRR